MKYLPLIFSLLLPGLMALGQQQTNLTHYEDNILSFNPGYAGSKQTMSFAGLHRSQWVGFHYNKKSATSTQMIMMHTPLKQKKLSLGITIINDRIFPLKSTSMNVDLAYKLSITKRASLSFGAKASLNHLQGDIGNLKLGDDQSDPAFDYPLQDRLLPNLGFGCFYQNQKNYVGLSVMRMLPNDYMVEPFTGTNISNFKEYKHIYLVGGTQQRLAPDFVLAPSVMIQMAWAAPVMFNVTSRVIYKEKISFGAMIRPADAYGFLIGFRPIENMKIGYSFDRSYGYNSTFRYNSGTHEIAMTFDVGKISLPKRTKKPKKRQHRPKFHH